MSRKNGYMTKTSTVPTISDTPTSSGVCTPTYILENAVSAISSTNTILSAVLLEYLAGAPKTAKAFCVCPLGKE